MGWRGQRTGSTRSMPNTKIAAAASTTTAATTKAQ